MASHLIDIPGQSIRIKRQIPMKWSYWKAKNASEAGSELSRGHRYGFIMRRFSRRSGVRLGYAGQPVRRFAKLPFLAAALLLSAAVAFATDITGTWTLIVETPGGTRQSTVEFRQDGKNLTGTMRSRIGETPLTGSADGDQVSFSVMRERNGQQFKIDYSAKVEDTKMTGTIKLGDNGDIPFTAAKK